MNKDETVRYMRSIGYDAENVNGTVVVWVSEPLRDGMKAKIRNRLMSVCYKGRWGWRLKKQAKKSL